MLNLLNFHSNVISKINFKEDKENLGDDPYPNFLQGGAEGQTFRDLKDFFYYA